MHLIESYALTCGCFIDQCFIEEEKIELPKNKYITLHAYNSKGSTRQYLYWNDVILDLQKNNAFDYEIVQVGALEDYKYNVNTEYLGKTSFNSLAYLIHHSSLHLGFDSFPVHLASHFQKKIVALYAHYSKNTGPYFSNLKDIVLFDAYQYSTTKPVFSQEDQTQLINKVPAKQISDAVLKLLKI
jgi:ADP-heptose:LPS heptosyltransferase